MENLTSRNTQTKVKHEILQDYLKTWGSIIVSGLRRPYENLIGKGYGSTFSTRFVYVDCFAFMGRYSDNTASDGWVPGSPLLGIKALDSIREFAIQNVGFKPEIYVILFEQVENTFDRLLESLDIAGYASRVRRQTTDFSSLKNGDIAVLNADYRQYLDALLDFTCREYTWAFYFLDPYGPKGMGLSSVGKIISQRCADVMINFPYLDLHKKAGSARRETPEHIAHLGYWDEMYGDKTWREIADKFQDDPDSMETELVKHYSSCLQSRDRNIAIKTIPLRFQDRERTMFYLFLTTHDPTGGLAMNEVLHDAKQDEHDYRIQWKTDKEREKTGGYKQQSLFDDAGTNESTSRRPSKEEIAESIYELCRGETLEFREVLRRIVNTSYFPEEVKSAMRLLKKQKRAEFERSTPQNADEIRFT